MTDQSDPPDDFDDEPTQVSASAPLVAYGNTPAEMLADRTAPSAHRHSGDPTGVTKETDMSTMPETRSAAREVLAREVESRRTRPTFDGSAPHRRSATVQDRRTEARTSAPEPLPQVTPSPGQVWRTRLSGPAGWVVQSILETLPEKVELRSYDQTERRCVSMPDFLRDYRPDGMIAGVMPPRRPEESRSLASAPPLDLTVAVKADSGKTRYELISPHFKRALAEVLTFGAVKYADHNWRKGFLWSRLMGAAERHMEAIKRGELRDPESGLLHTAHWGFCVMALHDHIEFGMGENDLPWADQPVPTLSWSGGSGRAPER